MATKIDLTLFQDPIVGEITILSRVEHEPDRVTRYGNALTLSAEEFRARGLLAIQEILASYRVDPSLHAACSNDNRGWWELYSKRHKYIELSISGDRPEATICVMHYDNHWQAGPLCGECSVVPLESPAEAFAAAVSEAFAKSKDFRWLEWSLQDVQSFFCIYHEARSGRYYWFDWVRVNDPENEGDGVTAWGRPRVFDQETLERRFGRLTTESLQQFGRRQEQDNPNPLPRGSQVEDAGVADQRRVVVFQQEDPMSVFMRAYAYDLEEREQVESGFELEMSVDASTEVFFANLMKSFAHCTI